MPSQYNVGQRGYLPKTELGALVQELQKQGYTVLGPKLVDGVVMLRPLQSADDLAKGIQDEQEGGRYRTKGADPEAYFQYGPGPDSPKRYLFPPTQRLFSLHIQGNQFVFDEGPPQPPKLAFLGVRPCELAAMEIQDTVFGSRDRGHFRCELDAYYQEARKEALLIAVNCTRPSGNCFCTSMGTGPQVTKGFDLAMTEMRAGFVIEVGSSRGGALLQTLPVREPTSSELELVELRLEQARQMVRRHLDTRGLRELLVVAIANPQWEEFGKNCLGCGNCTMVCPTCFCSTVTDSTDLSGKVATRTRQWESCYTHQFSYTTSGPLRSSIRARHRHWLRHKQCTWFDQFGTSGCVGCGRCTTWCPAGIDFIKEVAAVANSVKAAGAVAGSAQGVLS